MVKISEAELEVMKVIWKRKETTSVEIIEELKEQKNINWNFNTIRTLIKRLLVKGAIEIVKKQGKTYTYRPIIEEEKYKMTMTKKLLQKWYNDCIDELVLQYCQLGLTVSEMKSLIQKIDEIIVLKEKNN